MTGSEPDVTRCVGRARSEGAGGHNVLVDARNTAADVVAAVDRRAPGLIRFLSGLRWAGLRTLQPERATWAALVAAGTGIGMTARWLVGRLGGRPRPSVPVAAALGQGVAWFALWRWDTARWRRNHVALVVELPPQEQLRLLGELRSRGLDVDRWEKADRAGGRTGGIICRSRDLRTVNGAIDAALHGRIAPVDDAAPADDAVSPRRWSW